MKRNVRDTYKYVLKDGKRVVYVGVTNDPARRLEEHNASKDFSHLKIEGRRTTLAAAKKWERDRLATYRRNHGGQNPKFNNTNHG